MSKRKTTEEVIKEFVAIHGDKYDYSKFAYVKAKVKGIIICKSHNHEFYQSADNHKNGSGCPLCGRERSEAAKYTTTEQYLEKFKKVHGDKYKCLDSKLTSNKKARFECSTHGEFKQTPIDHAQGRGCPECAIETRTEAVMLGRDEIIKRSVEAHGDTYDYSKMTCDKITDKGTIWCKEHEEYFTQYMVAHVRGTGCPKCGMRRSNQFKHDDYESFANKVKLVHEGNLDVTKFEYKGSQVKGIVICKKHNYEFINTPNGLLQGIGCPKCGNSISKGEGEVEEFLKSFTEVTRRSRKIIDNNREIDIFLPEYNVGVEYNGLYWHSDVFLENNYHLNKTKSMEDQGYKLIHIFEDEWLNNKDIIKSRLKNIIGVTDNKIFARKTEIREISSKISSKFLKENHLQGSVNSSVKIGLYYEDKLVSVATFGKLRKSMGSKSKEGVYELYRFCNKLNTNVVGGASKLLKYFIKEYSPKEIISYADRRWSNGDLYTKIGFELVSKTRPNYFYTRGVVRENRFSYRKDILVAEGFDENKTEREIMKERGYNRIYDCGTLKFSYKIY